MVVAMNTLFTSTARGAALLAVSLMAQVERFPLKIILDIMAEVTRPFPAQNIQYQRLKFGLEAKSDISPERFLNTWQTPME